MNDFYGCKFTVEFYTMKCYWFVPAQALRQYMRSGLRGCAPAYNAVPDNNLNAYVLCVKGVAWLLYSAYDDFYHHYNDR